MHSGKSYPSLRVLKVLEGACDMDTWRVKGSSPG